MLGGGLLFYVMYRWARDFLQHHDLPSGAGADRLVGEVGVVTVGIEPQVTDRRGRVTIGAEVWGALCKDDASLPAGTRVRVASVIGTRVLVEPIGGAAAETEINREDAT